MDRPWHTLSAAEASQELQTDPASGLSPAEAERRLKEYGPNTIKGKPPASFLIIFLSQFKDVMILVLLSAAAVSGLIREWKDSFMILLVVGLNAVLGSYQEFKAERSLAELKKLSEPQTLALRGGKIIKIPSSSLVPGDIMVLESGSRLSADARLLEAFSLKTDESTLTGESVAIDKFIEPLKKDDVPVADRKNMVFSGTSVTYGRGKALITGTGKQTELGKIADMLSEQKEEQTPLQKRFAHLGKWLALIALSVCALIFGAGILSGEGLINMFLTSISLAVAAIPEGLPIVVTIALALGAQRLIRRHAIIRRLPAVEALGSVTVICSDKTGTLTQNKMVVRDIYINGMHLHVTGRGYHTSGEFHKDKNKIEVRSVPELEEFLYCGLLCNDAELSEEGILGDPTEGSLVVLAAKGGQSKSEALKLYPRIDEMPFDSQRKMMTTIHKDPQGGYRYFSKGALDVLLSLCPGADKEKVLEASLPFAKKGMRILGLATKIEQQSTREENGFKYLGFVAISDPPRPEVKEAVRLCRQAHIIPIMVTGDHKLTALSIAREIDLAHSEDEVLEGIELAKMSQAELSLALDKVRIFARVSPEHKLKIIQALKQKDHIVAMTGDGVNDAPALKKADIGVAMGISGTDVSKEASDMVLTDDNFATIVSAVEEGRGIYDNIKKFLRYMLTTNSGEVLTMFFSIILRLPLPLLPLQILWVNFVTDGPPALALSVEPMEKDLMLRPPRDPKEPITSEGLLLSMLGVGLLMAAGTLWVFFWGLNNGGLLKARTLAFTTLAFFQMAHVMNCRSLKRSLFKIGWLSNPQLIFSILAVLLMQSAVIYIPLLQGFFKTTALNFYELSFSLGVAALPIPLVEARKLIQDRKKDKPDQDQGET